VGRAPYAAVMDRSDWWTTLDPSAAGLLDDAWIPVGAPGFAGDAKRRWREVLDGRFGSDGWRLSHVVRGRIVPFDVAILEYEASYRSFLRDRPPLVRFLVEQLGNVYDWGVENVHDAGYVQPDSAMNHYQDVAVRRVISALVPDPAWPWVTDTGPGDADLVDLGSGAVHRVPRARGFHGGFIGQIREPDSPLYALSPAVVPAHDPALLATVPGRTEWYHAEGCGHLSVEAFWQSSKVVEVRYARFLALGGDRAAPLAGL
jgi:hypothetical protein